MEENTFHSPSWNARRLAWAIALLALGLYLFTTRGVRVADNYIHADVAIGIIERGSVALGFEGDEEERCSIAARGPDGRYYSSLGPGLEIAALPLVAAGSLVARLTGADERSPTLAELFQRTFFADRRPDSIRRFRQINRDPRMVGFSLVSPLCGAAVVLLFVLIAAGMGLGPRASLVAAAGLAAASPLFTFSGTGWTQPLACLCICWSFFSLLLFCRAPGLLRAALCGAGLAAACLTRVDQFPLCLPFLAAVVVGAARHRSWPAGVLHGVVFGAPVLVALIGAFAWNWIRFGHLLGPACAFQTHGWSFAFFFEGFFGQLVSLDAGLLLYAPVLVLVPFGLRRLHRCVSLPAMVALSVFLFQWLMYSFWWDWNSKMCYGPRLLVQSMPFLFLFVAAFLDRAGRKGLVAALVLIGLGFLIQLPGALLSPLKLPHVFHDQAWDTVSWFVGWAVLFKGAYAVEGTSWMGDVIECLSGRVPFFLATSIASFIGAWLVWRRRR